MSWRIGLPHLVYLKERSNYKKKERALPLHYSTLFLLVDVHCSATAGTWPWSGVKRVHSIERLVTSIMIATFVDFFRFIQGGP